MDNCPHCHQQLTGPLALAAEVIAYFEKLSPTQKDDFRRYHSISFPIAFVLAKGYVPQDQITPRALEWLDGLHREVAKYKKEESRTPRFVRSFDDNF